MPAERRSPVRWATAFLDVAPGDVTVAAAFWCGVTRSSPSPRRGARGEFTTLVPPDGDAYLRMQELVVGPARAHLDLHVQDVADVAARAVALGAEPSADEGASAEVLVSPGGFVFCLVPHHGESLRPAPTTWPGGHRSVVDQLCLDIPAPKLEAEGRFWSALMGWAWFGTRPDFTVLDRPAGQPVRPIFQRLDDAEPDQPVSGHLDLACDDAEAEADRHVGLGARVVRRMPYWVTLEDPTGREYCVTRRDPDTGFIPH
jgi:predicted enzyme related to lactoylglutathione lyase